MVAVYHRKWGKRGKWVNDPEAWISAVLTEGERQLFERLLITYRLAFCFASVRPVQVLGKNAVLLLLFTLQSVSA